MAAMLAPALDGRALTDPFGRRITYLRLSVTDRCDLRCTYCMPERMAFLPKGDVLSLEELARLGSAFIERGVTRIRLTGGEPLVRRDIMRLIRALGRRIGNGLDELTITTNGTQLARYAAELFEAGVRRVNVSLDSRDPERFREITRRGDLAVVLEGIETARAAGLKIKLNMVALKGVNEGEIVPTIAWAHENGMDITLIETMPMGEIAHREETYLSLNTVRTLLSEHWTIVDIPDRTGGPARYVRVAETGGRLGFITPLSHNFCEACNRVRITCTGELFMCLGQEAKADLRAPLRASVGDDLLNAAIDEAIARKPRGHDFDAARLAKPAVGRTMSVTGG